MSRVLPFTAGLAVSLLLLVGCQSSREAKNNDETPPFVFRSLDLRQQDRLGRPAWELTSPEARYDLRRRIARAESPKGVIHANGKPLYRLQADSGTVISDGQAILLEGHLRVERLSQPAVLIRAARARWLPRQKLLLVDRSPEVYDHRGRLRADRARFRFDTDTLELSGAPRLDRWSKPFNPLSTLPKDSPEITVQVSSLTWKPGTGALDAEGPVLGERRVAGAAPGSLPQRLSAERLQGNTQSQAYTLLGAVHFEDPAQADQLDTRDVQLDLANQAAETALPFSLVHGGLKATGTGLKVFLKDSLAVIAAQCHVEQSGERLDAQRCQWNWRSGAVEAHGSVLLQRQANRQNSRAEHLVGDLGQAGSITLSAPGARVVSRFQVPQQRP